MRASNFGKLALVAAAAGILVACGGGGSTVAPSGQVTNKVSPNGATTALAGQRVAVAAEAKASFDAIVGHTWKITKTAGDQAVPTPPTFADASCAGANVVPGKRAMANAPGINGTSHCATELVIASDTPASEWLVENTARSTDGSANGKFTLKVTPLPKVVTGFGLTVPAVPEVFQVDKTARLKAGATLNAGFEYDEPLKFEWTQVSGPATVALAGAATDTAAFTPRVAGEYVFKVKLSATIRGKAEVREGAVVAVVEAGGGYTVSSGALKAVPLGETVRLDGAVTGSNVPSSLSYKWTQTAGPAVALYGGDSLNPEFTPTVVGDYEFELQVTRNGDTPVTKSSRTKVSVYTQGAAASPYFTVSAGATQVATPGSIATLSGQVIAGTPAPTNLAYSWAQISGPTVSLSGAASQNATFLAAGAGTYVFEFTATAGSQVKTDQVTVVVSAAPTSTFTVDAGAIKTSPANTTVNLQGVLSGSAAPSSLQIAWTQVTGPATTIFNADKLGAQFLPTAAGDYEF
ncbi:hypothetical protein LC612_36275, partial [Nostoc sp. CHAB 5834]|nr:hypothetical protein [Nostoc sp. CHAB 5834]